MSMIQQLVYIAASLLLIIGLKRLSSPATARQGNFLSAFGMLIALVVTLFDQSILSYQGILLGLGIGTVIGVFAARLVAMTAMPEMVALLNGFGGASSLFVGWAVVATAPISSMITSITVLISVVIGGLTFSGSMIAWGKLSEKIGSKPLLFWGQKYLNLFILLIIVINGVLWAQSMDIQLFYLIISAALLLGVLAVVSIGGGDMPVVISLLNSYSGIAACAAGFVIENMLLIVAGALVGASGLILTNIMCKSMNRSLRNVLFSGFGSETSSGGSSEQEGEVNPISSSDAYLILEAAQSVMIVPGYGMAVAQAQHAIKELSELMENNGKDVKFAIHPVAGRMPGHMNVLLAEADVPYDQLYEMDDVNPIMESVDVCLVIGANDVVNPDALQSPESPIYGMPIIEVSRAKTVFVLKRSMNVGFAGIQNPLFFKPNTRMLFGDAKESLNNVVVEFKE